MDPGIRLIFTTRREKSFIDFPKVLCIEDLCGDLSSAKEKVIANLIKGVDDTFIVGVDPGKRIGIAAYYRQFEVYSGVANSVRGACNRITRLIKGSSAEKKIVRIGDGNPSLAKIIAEDLYRRVKPNTEIELVDERGTSSPSRAKPNKRAIKDQLSAKLIARREGKRMIF